MALPVAFVTLLSPQLLHLQLLKFSLFVWIRDNSLTNNNIQDESVRNTAHIFTNVMMSFGYPAFTDTFVHNPLSFGDFLATGAATSVDTPTSTHHGTSFRSLDVSRWRGQVGTHMHKKKSPVARLNPCNTTTMKGGDDAA